MQMTMPGVGELIKSGRAFVAERWGTIVLASLVIPMVFSGIMEGLGKTMEDSSASGLLSLVSFLISLLLSLGLKRITIDLVDGKDAKLEDLFSQSALLLKYILAGGVYVAGVALGFLLLLAPGVYVALKYGFFPYILVDRPELSAMESLKESARLTEGIKWDLLIFAVAMIGINILGVLALGIGLLYTVPVSVMAYTALYRSLTRIGAAPEAVAPPVTPEATVATPTETPAV